MTQFSAGSRIHRYRSRKMNIIPEADTHRLVVPSRHDSLSLPLAHPFLVQHHQCYRPEPLTYSPTIAPSTSSLRLPASPFSPLLASLHHHPPAWNASCASLLPFSSSLNHNNMCLAVFGVLNIIHRGYVHSISRGWGRLQSYLRQHQLWLCASTWLGHTFVFPGSFAA